MKRILVISSIVFAFLGLFWAPGSVSAATPAKSIKILLVPGHDDTTWGAQYGTTKEADMNLALATKIYNTLRKDKRFEVHITRNKSGYTKEFSDYFEKEKDAINNFRKVYKAQHQQAVGSGNFIEKENVDHNTANERTSFILYAINRWADENLMDAVIHVHFNDYPRETPWTVGIYRGFAIYVPESQMVNSTTSTNLAKRIFTELKKKYAVSTYEKEKAGIVPDQSLIALGAKGTLFPNVRSVLIEYGYIYRFKSNKSREANYTTMAAQTVTGIKNYFFPKK